MDWIFDNLYVVLIVAGALISWLKNRAESQSDTSDEERAREELIRDLEERDRSPQPTPKTPPPLARERQAGPPQLRPQPAPTFQAPQPMPKASVADPYAVDDSPHHRQQDMEQRLEELRIQQKESQQLAKQARENRIRASHQANKETNRTPAGPLKLRSALKDPRQSRRAIVLREILGPPVAQKR